MNFVEPARVVIDSNQYSLEIDHTTGIVFSEKNFPYRDDISRDAGFAGPGAA